MQAHLQSITLQGSDSCTTFPASQDLEQPVGLLACPVWHRGLQLGVSPMTRQVSGESCWTSGGLFSLEAFTDQTFAVLCMHIKSQLLTYR